jgi:hypothetical protein
LATFAPVWGTDADNHRRREHTHYYLTTKTLFFALEEWKYDFGKNFFKNRSNVDNVSGLGLKPIEDVSDKLNFKTRYSSRFLFNAILQFF